MKTKQHILFFLLFVLLHFWSTAQRDIYLDLEQYTVADGLSHRQVNAIYQDENGFIWAGTEYGLNRFDGYAFDWWTKEINGLTSNRVRDLIEDGEGYLWIIDKRSTQESIYQCMISVDLLHLTTGELIPLKEKVGDTLPFQLEDVFSDRRTASTDGTLYFGTHTGARLISYKAEKDFEVFPLSDYQWFYPVAYTDEHTIWGIADDSIVVEVDTLGHVLHQFVHKGLISPYQVFYRPPNFYYNVIDNRYEYQNGTLYKVNERRQTEVIRQIPTTTLGGFDYDRIMYDKDDQAIWMFRLPNDIFYFSDQYQFNLMDYFPELQTDFRIGRRSVIVDDRKYIWLAGEFGLYRLETANPLFERYLYKDNLKEAIACRGITKQGDTLIVGTERYGLQIIEESIKKSIPIEIEKKFGEAVYVPFTTKSNEFWLGTSHLQRVELDTKQVIPVENIDNETVIWGVAEDANGRIWISRQFSLEYYEADQLHKFNGFDELAKSLIIAFVPDSENTFLLCTDRGIFELHIEKGIIARYWAEGEGKFQIPHNNIRHIHKDKDGIYWLATGGAGLIRWNKENGVTQPYTHAHGLANNFLYAIYEDERENLWMSSDYGIIQFNKRTEQSRSYLLEDGITHNEFNRISHYQDEDGRIYFGSLNGITTFHPKDFYQQDTVSNNIPLRITNFEQFEGKNNQIVDRTAELLQTNKITMYPNDRYFRLEFALLTYEAIDQIRYAYQIDGVDEEWTHQKERSIRISRLPYGMHTLKVKGQAADGQWSAQELAIQIEVLKPFYLQFWFLTFGMLSLVLFTYGFYRFYLGRQLAQQQATQLQEMNQLKSRFYTNITHEFRTPLTVILGMAQEEKDFSKARKLITRNGQKLLQLVNQLLDLSKIDTGYLTPNYQQIEIVSFTQHIGESFQSLADRKYIRLTIYSEIKELWMDMDEEKYRQIISNLLSNAIKFTSESGKIILHLVQEGNQLLIKVTDNGYGIEATQLPHIFDRFYQVENAQSKQGEGTGIGLALVKESVQLLGGKIQVESKINMGTTFSIQFPISRTSPRKLETYEDRSIDRSMIEDIEVLQLEVSPDLPRLLIIEDNADVVVYIQSLLSTQYELLIANNGEEGIEKAIEHTPDIIISDVMMPKKNGFEVVENLKQDIRTSHIPIILLTAKATQEDKIEGLKHGADAYLTKPFSKEELFIRLKNLIEVRRQLQQKYQECKVSDTSTALNLEEQFVLEVRQQIEANYTKADFNVEALAASLNMNRVQLFRKLKAVSNQTPSQMIRDFRLEKAKILLQNKQLNISEIAYELGYSDPNYFIRQFTKVCKQSPNTYRKSL